MNHHKQSWILYFLFSVLFTIGYIRSRNIAFNEQIGENGEITRIKVTKDGSLYLVCSISDAPNPDVWITKLNYYGDVNVSFSLGNALSSGEGKDVASTNDGNVLVLSKYGLLHLSKINLPSVIIDWTIRYSSPPNTYGGVFEQENGNIIVAASVNNDLQLNRVSSSGTPTETVEFSTPSGNFFVFRMRESRDGEGLIVSGRTSYPLEYRTFVARFMQNFTLEWAIRFTDVIPDVIGAENDFVEMKNGNVAALGSGSNEADKCLYVYVFQVKPTISLVWGKKICKPGDDFFGKGITETASALVVVASGWSEISSERGGFFLRLSKDTGSVLERGLQKLYFASIGNRGLEDVDSYQNGQAVMVGWTNLNGESDPVFQLSETDEICGSDEISSSLSITTSSIWTEFTGDITTSNVGTGHWRFDNPITVTDSLCSCDRHVNCYSCFGYRSDSPAVCSRHGSCENFDYCNCDGGYHGDECEDFKCFGIWSTNSSEPICSNWNETEHDAKPGLKTGYCLKSDYCECYPGYSSLYPGGICSEYECGGVSWRNSEVCDGLSKCVDADECEEFSCFGILSTNITFVCSPDTNPNGLRTGICVDKDTCACFPGYKNTFEGGSCTEWNCSDISRRDAEDVCEGKSECVATDQCEIVTCFGIISTNVSYVCQPDPNPDNIRTGVCVDIDTCVCYPGYSSTFKGGPCTEWSCHNISFRDAENVCEGRSKCVAADECEDYTCFGILSSNTTHSCQPDPNPNNIRTGKCIDHDKCLCFPGYASTFEGGPCSEWNCSDISWRDTEKVCGGFSECVASEECREVSCFGILASNVSFACQPDPNPNNIQAGVCIGTDKCECFPGYSGTFEGGPCTEWNCSDVSWRDPDNTCGGYSACIGADKCEDFTCFGILSKNVTHSCQPNPNPNNIQTGVCVSKDRCECFPGIESTFEGGPCTEWNCSGVSWRDSANVCEGFSDCISSDYCAEVTCFGVQSSNVSFACQPDPNPNRIQSGSCVGFDKCECFPGYSSTFEGGPCTEWNCSDVSWRDTENVCDGYSACIGADKCEDFTCFGILSKNVTHSCQPFPNPNNLRTGKCIDNDECLCFPGYASTFEGGPCTEWNCSGVSWRDSANVCDGFSECVASEECREVSCFGILASNVSFACQPDPNPNNIQTGVCVETDKCVCYPGYSSTFEGGPCTEWNCTDISWRDAEHVCGGYSECVSAGECGSMTCYGVPASEVTKVCTVENGTKSGIRTGVCVRSDKCSCFPGYWNLEEDGPCTEWVCGGQKWYESSVCSGRGECVRSEKCSCNEEYEGNYCDSWSCGVDKDHVYTCNGHGKCQRPQKCKCDFGYSGDYCDTNEMYYTIMAPALGVAGGVMVVMILVASVFIGILMCMCFYCVVIVVCCISCLCCCNLVQIGWKQRKGLLRFGQLRDFDLLLKEQEMEDDESIAHLRIRKGLFEIDFDEIKTERILGEGGSSAIVFKATWNSQIVAFKCFKTRKICQSQDQFTEFEREVEILGSLAHPNIIRFYGATMKPPRVGIVMEYCENGELMDFYTKVREEKGGKPYPLREKVRMCREISSSLQYIHARNVIHRDLKNENVLVDGFEVCKLMDFGLSRCVESMSIQKTKRIGTGVYMAPEIIKSGEYDEKCDVFSFAIMMWVMICEDKFPYGEDDEFNVEFRVSDDPNYRPKIEVLDDILLSGDENEGVDYMWLKALIQKCWGHSPQDRPSCEELTKVFDSRYEQTKKEDLKLVGNDEEVPSRRASVIPSQRKGGSRSDKEKMEKNARLEDELEKTLQKSRITRTRFDEEKKEMETMVRKRSRQVAERKRRIEELEKQQIQQQQQVQRKVKSKEEEEENQKLLVEAVTMLKSMKKVQEGIQSKLGKSRKEKQEMSFFHQEAVNQHHKEKNELNQKILKLEGKMREWENEGEQYYYYEEEDKGYDQDNGSYEFVDEYQQQPLQQQQQPLHQQQQLIQTPRSSVPQRAKKAPPVPGKGGRSVARTRSGETRKSVVVQRRGKAAPSIPSKSDRTKRPPVPSKGSRTSKY